LYLSFGGILGLRSRQYSKGDGTGTNTH